MTIELQLATEEKSASKIKVKLHKEDYLPEFDQKLKEYSKQVSLKGFRPGKVPTGLLKKMYGKGIKVDLISHKAYHAINDYVKDEKLLVVGDPLPNTIEADQIDWDNQEEFELVYDLGIVPAFEYDLDKLNIKSYQIQYSDDFLNTEIKNLQRSYGEMVDTEAVDKGDFIVSKFTLNLPKEDNALEFEEKEFDVTFSTTQLEDGLEDKFLNLAIGGVVEFENSAIFKQEELAKGKGMMGITSEDLSMNEGRIKIEITKIMRREDAVLNQEFYDKVFGEDNVHNEDEVKAKIVEDYNKYHQNEVEQEFLKQIKDSLLANTPIQLPDDFLKRWLFLMNEGKATMDMILQEFDVFEKELKWSLIRSKIATEFEISVSEQEVRASTAQELMTYFQRFPVTEEILSKMDMIITNYLNEENGKNYEQVYLRCLNKKLSDTLKEKIKVENIEIDSEAYEKLMNENYAQPSVVNEDNL